MRFVSPALKHIVFPVLSRSGCLRYAAGTGPVVVTYHGVFPGGYEVRDAPLDGNLVHASSLRRQLRLLKNRYHVITPDDFLHWSEGQLSLPPRSILLTCDDALRNALTEMVPILQESGFSCLFFATGASADEKPSLLWYEELYLMLLQAKPSVKLSIAPAGVRFGPIASNERHLTWWKLVGQLSPFAGEARREFLDQIRGQLELPDGWVTHLIQNTTVACRLLMLDRTGLRQLAAAGMSIGAHSLSHPILARTSDELAWREISESKSVLEKVIGQAVWAFGYPFGNAATVTARDIRLPERAGFRCAFMNVAGSFGAKMNHFAVPRVHITADMSVAEFEAHISGFYSSLRHRLLGDDTLRG